MMTSRLTVSALLFSLVSTAAGVWTLQSDAEETQVRNVRIVKLERVEIRGKRLPAAWAGSEGSTPTGG